VLVYTSRTRHQQSARPYAAGAGLSAGSVTLGVPFYGRHTQTGDWKTFEDLAKEHPAVGVSGGGDEVAGYYFNGPDTIKEKVKMVGLGRHRMPFV
jgi:hypothetical protein